MNTGAAELFSDLAESFEEIAKKLREAEVTEQEPVRLVSTLEAARVLSVSPRTLTRWADEGCPCVRMAGGRRRWDFKEIQQWLAERGGAS